MNSISDFLGNLISLANGRKLIMFNKFTYYNIGQLKRSFKWNCTIKSCQSYLLVSSNLDIEKVVENHNHVPPKYKVLMKKAGENNCLLKSKSA